MEAGQTLLVGMDLCRDFSQISCYNNNIFEPVNLITDMINDSEMISMKMAVNVNTGEWFFGEEAVDNAAFFEEVGMVEDLFDRAVSSKPVEVLGVKIKTVDIFEKFFRKYLSQLKRYNPNATIKKLVITVEDTNINLVSTIFEALLRLGLNRDRVSVIDHSQSYVYYALSQKKELWMNDVALFDFGSDGLKYYQISVDRKHRPITVSVGMTDYTQRLNLDLFKTVYVEQLRYIFETIARECLYKQIVSTIYVTGKGFEKSWADSVIKELCVGRRAFKGQNLFCWGACYAARSLAGETDHFNDFLFLSKDVVKGTVQVSACTQAKYGPVSLINAGELWYESDNSLDFILDDSNEIEIIVKNEFKNTRANYIIVLEGLKKRPNKATRLRLRARYIDNDSCVVTVKDLGFGEFFAGTDRVWEKVINISSI